MFCPEKITSHLILIDLIYQKTGGFILKIKLEVIFILAIPLLVVLPLAGDHATATEPVSAPEPQTVSPSSAPPVYRNRVSALIMPPERSWIQGCPIQPMDTNKLPDRFNRSGSLVYDDTHDVVGYTRQVRVKPHHRIHHDSTVVPFPMQR